MRKSVLIPSDNHDFVINFAEAYRDLGYEVATGTFNFELECSNPDILHILWPEELTQWQVPTREQLSEIRARLKRWAQKSHIIFTVNNLYPHRHHGDPLCHELYSIFYEHASVVHHFSETSKRLVCAEYPIAQNRRHIVKLGFNNVRLLPSNPLNRTLTRSTFGFQADDFVVLIFGSFRLWQEVRFLTKAFSLARIPNKRILGAARYQEPGKRWKQFLRKQWFKLWLSRQGSTGCRDWIADGDVSAYFEAADVVFVVRQNGLTSGVPALAMTFGRPVVAPRYGSTPDFFEGTGNLSYDESNPHEAALALEKLAKSNLTAIGQQNKQVTKMWVWRETIDACLASLSAAIS